MKITEWTERNLYVNKDLKVLDNSMNEYRDDDGQIQYLELPNRLFKRMNDVLEDMYFTYSNSCKEGQAEGECDEPESFDNWGVKWNMSKEAILTLENGKAELEFDSPNSTIIPIIKRLGELYPELTFNLNYDEGGLCFRGEFEMKEGVVSLDEYEEYGSDEL